MSVTESPEPVSPIFEFSEEELKIRTEFTEKIQNARQDIQTKFIELGDKLKQVETRLLERLDGIESEILNKFELSSKALLEISEAKKQIIGTLKTDLTNSLARNTIEMYEKEIEKIKNNSTIDSSTIQLKWNADQFEKLCELTLTDQVVPQITNPSLLTFPTTEPNQTTQENLSPDFMPRPIYQINIQPPRYTEIPVRPEFSSYRCPMSSYSQLPCRDMQPPIVCPIPEKQGRYESDKHWQCLFCLSYNLLKHSYCEKCFKNPSS